MDDQLRGRIETLEQQVKSLAQQTTSVARRLRWWRRLACSLAVLTVFSLPLSLGADNDEIRALRQRIRALERKLQHVTSEIGPEGYPELVITAANLRIVNGLGLTDCGADPELIPNCPNGVGNLIVGYNEPRFPFEGETIRTGSHNVVVGTRHNFSTFGGLVVGVRNEISGAFASVSGGQRNTASGFSSSVSGGFINTASAGAASVSGGTGNTASENQAWVGGGVGNTASGFGASVSGGRTNTAGGFGASVSGGFINTAIGFFASVSGGSQRTAEGEFDWVAGGLFQDQ